MDKNGLAETGYRQSNFRGHIQGDHTSGRLRGITRGYGLRRTILGMKRVLLAAILTTAAAAQPTLPARPGVILYVEGQVALDGKAVGVWPARGSEMRDGAAIHSENGRAQLMLNPCTLLHLGERSTLRMEASSLTAMRLELITGSVVVEDDSGNHRRGTVELVVQRNALQIVRDGIFRFDSDPARVRVFAGSLSVKGAGVLTAGRALVFGALATRFDRKQMDDLQTWSDQRVRLLRG